MPNGEILRKLPQEVEKFKAPEIFKDRGEFYNWMLNEIEKAAKEGEIEPTSGKKAKERILSEHEDYKREVQSDKRIKETIDAHAELLGFTSQEFFATREKWKDLVNRAEKRFGLSVDALEGPASLMDAIAKKAQKGEYREVEEIQKFVEIWLKEYRSVNAKYSEMVKKLIEDTDLIVP